ncbi:DUF4012 domain-containing protein [Demequina iriomotensis]|uniref:DUF4012 domain-containing protein n=1 Tax=Demequina iriomotensis TaxID=1536641 RepID=UPI000AA3E26D|nr:DUF4012 domain-containing protein [Demequina iriomotensis]
MAEGGRKRRRRWPWIVAGVVVAILVAGGLMAADAWRAYQASEDLSSHSTDARAALIARDADALRAEVGGLQDAAHRLEDATDGPLWAAAAVMPWVGDQVRPVRAMAESSVAIADEALAPLAELADLDALSGPSIVKGRIDPYLLEPAREPLGQAAATLVAQEEALGAVSLAGTEDFLADQYRDAADQVGEMAALVDGAHRAAELLPTMLGGEEPRSYLVMVQNNAEPRATGGITGAVVKLNVDDGQISRGRYVASSDLIAARTAEPVEGLTAEEEQTFSVQMAMYPQDVNFTPEFPRAAALVTEFWSRKYGEDVDGVLALDPVVLGYLLQGASPVDVAGVALDAKTVAPLMLNRAYLEIEDASAQDAFFAEAAGALFREVLRGAPGLGAGIERAIDERRLLIWSADDAEQAVLAGSEVAGDFLDGDSLGVFLNDGSGSKIGYYLDAAVTVTDHLCTDGTVAGQTVAVSLDHTFDGDVADLPAYVAGGTFVPAGQFAANLLVVPPPGLTLVSATLDGEPLPLQADTVEGRTVATARVELAPGNGLVAQYELEGQGGAVAASGVVVTPGPRATEVVRVDDAAAGC